MAQAARLSLRMQKELKLLLSDPPPGASFPFLSADGGAALSSPSSSSSSSSSSSLTTIDAEIEGPEGTVYSSGIFKIRIQIPERYPFQPPAVTFATPIYHPNIDNGGRICLDILNLPPKGAWQPSLNVSTVITSIGLLLSEPNPDDGLMCDASREFKYNRQAFDLKARTMTEKYAKASSGMVSSSQGTEQTVELRLTGDTEVGDEIKTEDSKKLPLDLSVSRCEKDGNEKANEVTAAVRYTLEFKKKSEPEESSQTLNTNEVYSVGDFCKKQKLPLSSLGKPKQSGCYKQNSPVDQQVPSHSTTTKIRAVNGSKLQSCQVSNYNQQEHDMHPASQGKVSSTSENCKRYTGSKKLSLGFSVMSRNQDTCENENTMPVRKLTGERLDKSEQDLSSNSVKPEFAKQGGPRGGSGDTDLNKRKCKVELVLAKEEVEEPRDLSLLDPRPCSIPQQRGYTKECQSSIDHRDASQNKQKPDPSLTVIVLDSDESDEEERSRCRRSKLSLLSKRPSWGNTKEHKAL